MEFKSKHQVDWTCQGLLEVGKFKKVSKPQSEMELCCFSEEKHFPVCGKFEIQCNALEVPDGYFLQLVPKLQSKRFGKVHKLNLVTKQLQEYTSKAPKTSGVTLKDCEDLRLRPTEKSSPGPIAICQLGYFIGISSSSFLCSWSHPEDLIYDPQKCFCPWFSSERGSNFPGSNI